MDRAKLKGFHTDLQGYKQDLNGALSDKVELEKLIQKIKAKLAGGRETVLAHHVHSFSFNQVLIR